LPEIKQASAATKFLQNKLGGVNGIQKKPKKFKYETFCITNFFNFLIFLKN